MTNKTFKAGDKAYHILRGEWVTLEESKINSEILIDGYQTQYYFDGRMHKDHKYPVLLDHEPEEHKWKPKEGDLCWFWDRDKTTSLVLSRFNKMEGDVYMTIGMGYLNCAPFEGSLPKGVEL